MTLRQFLKQLSAYKGQAHSIRDYGVIRFGLGNTQFNGYIVCPIDQLGGNWTRPDGGLGLTLKDRDDIIDAADLKNPYSRRQRYIRKRMIEVLGLEA